MDSCLKSNEMQGGCTASFMIYQSRKQCNTQKSRIPGGKEEERALASRTTCPMWVLLMGECTGAINATNAIKGSGPWSYTWATDLYPAHCNIIILMLGTHIVAKTWLKLWKNTFVLNPLPLVA